MRRKFHAIEVLVVGINCFDQRVTREARVQMRLDALDDVLVVDRAGHRVLAESGERHARLAARGGRLRGGGIRGRAPEESVRGEPDVVRSHLGAPVGVLVLEDISWNRADSTLPCGWRERTGPAAACRPFAVNADDLL